MGCHCGRATGISGASGLRQLYNTFVHLAGQDILITADCRDDTSEDILGRDVITSRVSRPLERQRKRVGSTRLFGLLLTAAHLIVLYIACPSVLLMVKGLFSRAFAEGRHLRVFSHCPSCLGLQCTLRQTSALQDRAEFRITSDFSCHSFDSFALLVDVGNEEGYILCCRIIDYMVS